MTNTLLLKKHMKNKHITISALSKLMRIDRVTLFRKINNECGFWAREIMAIKEVLELSSQEVCEIFLTKTDTKCDK